MLKSPECLGNWNIVRDCVADCESFVATWRDEPFVLYKNTQHTQNYKMEFEGVAAFEVTLRPDSVDVCVDTIDGACEDTVSHLLNDQFVPRILAQLGNFVIHAAGVSLHRSAVLFVAPSCAGKSTLAANFLRADVALLGDDAFVIDFGADTPRCRSLYPSLRLSPEAIEALGLAANAHEPVATYTTKRAINFESRADRGSTPIKAIYLIDPEPREQISIRPLSPRAASVRLIEQSFSLDPSDPDQACDRLTMACRLAQDVPVFELAYPRGFETLAAVRRAILTHLHDVPD